MTAKELHETKIIPARQELSRLEEEYKKLYRKECAERIGAIAFVAMFVFIALLVYCICEERNTLGVVCLFMVIAMLILMCLSFINNENNIHHIEYKVVIDDSVSMAEFMDKYEIIDQEGKIYTVKERE